MFLSNYENNSMFLDRVLIDTGCMISIFDTDLVDQIGLYIQTDIGKTVRMYGIGGQSELCFQQKISELIIDHYTVRNVAIQLGMTKEPYGFDAILGADFFVYTKLIIDFNSFEIH